MKIKVVCGILALLIITVGVANLMPSGYVPPGFIGDNPFLENPSMVLPEGVTIDNLINTVAENTPAAGITPDGISSDPQINAKQALYTAAKVLKDSGGFKSVTDGSSSSMGFAQGVHSERTVVGNDSFKMSTSYSSIVKFGEQLYVRGDKYLSRSADKVKNLRDVTWKNSATTYTEAEFMYKIGSRNTDLTGYVLNDLTILDAYLESAENDMYTFRYKLDVNTAPFFVLYEMRNNAGSSKFATFYKAELVITMDSNYYIQTLTTDCKYKAASMGLHVDCTESLTEKFYDIGNTTELPEMEFFESQVGNTGPDTPVDTQPTSLDVLMGMFAPYISGERLNASVDVSLGKEKCLSALVGLNLDMENMANTKADVKIGNGLYVSYDSEQLYVTYQDFKARTTLDGVMQLVNNFLPKQEKSDEGGFDVEALLAGMTHTIADGKCSVNIPITLGDIQLNATLYGTVDGTSYTFIGAKATVEIANSELADIVIDIKPVSAWQVPERQGEYPEILGITDQLLKDSAILANINVFGISADIIFDVPTTTLYAQAAGMTVIFQNNVLYAQIGESKLKFDVNDVDQIATLLAPFIGDTSIELPEISLQDILNTIGNITVVKTEKGVVLSFGLDGMGLQADISLLQDGANWRLGDITVAAADFTATVTQSKGFEIPEIGNASDYVDVTEVANAYVPAIVSLVNAESFAIDDLRFALQVGEKRFSVEGNILLNVEKGKNAATDSAVSADLNVFETANGKDVLIANVDVIFADETVFLNVNGIKVAFAVGDMGDLDLGNLNLDLDITLINELTAKIEEVISAVKNIDIPKIDLSAILEKLTFDSESKTLTLLANGEKFALGTIDLVLSAKDNALTFALSDFEFGPATVSLGATVAATDKKVTPPASTDEYILNLKTSVLGADVQLSANLLTMDIAANVTFGKTTVNARFVDNTLYAQLGGAKIKLTLEELSALLNDLGVELDTGSLDVKSLLGALKWNMSADTPSISLETDSISVFVNFVRSNGKINLGNVTVKLAEKEIVVEQSNVAVTPIDIDGFTSASPLVDEILRLVRDYGNLNDGISAELATSVTLNGNKYFVSANVQFNGGLHAVAEIYKDNANGAKLLVADVFYIPATQNRGAELYLDLNGIRVAANFDELQEFIASLTKGAKANSNILDTLLAGIGSNAQFADIVTGIKDLVAAFKNFDVSALNIASVLTSLAYNSETDTWTLVLNGNGILADVNLGENVVLTLCGSTVTLDGISVAGIGIDNLVATVGKHEQTIVAPNASDYLTELEISVGNLLTANLQLDLYNFVVNGYINIWDTTVSFTLQDKTVYVVCGGANLCLPLNRIGELIDEITKLTGSNNNGISLDVAEILEGLRISTANGLKISAAVAGANVDVAFTTSATLSAINVTIGETTISVTPPTQQITYAPVDTTKDFVNVVDVLNTYGSSIKDLMSATGFTISASGNVTLNGNTYDIAANATFNLPVVGTDATVERALELHATLAMNGSTFLKADVWLVNNRLYLALNDLKVTLNIGASNDNGAVKTTAQNLDTTLAPLYGYNAQVDEILDLVKGIISNVKAGNLNIAALIENLTFTSENDNATLSVGIDGSAFGVSTANGTALSSGISLQLTKLSNGLFEVQLGGLAFEKIAINALDVTVAQNTASVSEPTDDFTTEIVLTLDAQGNNKLYGRLDLVNKVYDFALVNQDKFDNALYFVYSDNTLKIKKSTSVLLTANIDAIAALVERIDEIVKSFAGTTSEGSALPNFGSSLSIDWKQLINSIAISQTSDDTESVEIALTLFGMPVKAVFGCDSTSPRIDGIFVTASLLGEERTLSVKANTETNITFGNFDDENDEYIAIEDLLNDYFDAIENLINTNCWRFDFNENAQLDIVDNNSTTSLRILAGSYFEFFYNTSNKNDLTLRAVFTIQISENGGSWQDLIKLDALYAEEQIWLVYNDTLKLTLNIQSIKDCGNAFEDLKTAIPQLGTLFDQIKSMMENAGDNFSSLDFTNIIKHVSYGNFYYTTDENGIEYKQTVDEKIFDLKLNGGLILSDLGDIVLRATNNGVDTMTLNFLQVVFKNITITLQSVTVKSAQMTESGQAKFDALQQYNEDKENGVDVSEIDNSQFVMTPQDYEIASLKDNFFATYGLYNADTNTFNTSNFISFNSLPELLKAVADTATKTTFAIDGLVTAKLDIGADWLASATIPLMLSIRVDRVQHEDGDEDVFIAAMLQRFDTKANILGSKKSLYNDAGGQSYLYFDSTVKYILDENGNTIVDEDGNPYVPEGTKEEDIRNGWFTVTRHPYNGTTNEAWTEISVYDYCNDCQKVAEDNCYLTYCNLCNKEADDNCKTVGYCTVCNKVADNNCLIDYCNQCGKPADGNCYVDYCNDCGAPATSDCKTGWCFDCNKQTSALAWKGCANLLHNRGTKHSITAAHSNKIVSAHDDKIHTSESVRAPHTVNTVMEEIAHDTGKPNLEAAAHYYSGSVTDFTQGKVDRKAGSNTYTISRLENEIFEMMNLGTIKVLVSLNLEDIILGQIHKEDSGMDTSISNLLGNLQNIFVNYEYVVPENDNPFFHLTANLAPINSSFGTLDLSIGHAITYKDVAVLDEGNNVIDTQTVIDKLNLTYLHGTFGIANVVNLRFQLALAQNWEDYRGDAQYFVQNRPLWDAADHAANFQD